MYRRFFSIILAVSAAVAICSCKKDNDDDDKEYMTGDLSFEIPTYVLKGQKISATISGITYPEDVKYFWVSTEMKINEDSDTLLGNKLDITITDDPGKYTIVAYASYDGYYTKLLQKNVIVLSPDESSISGIKPSFKTVLDDRDGKEYYIARIGNLDWFVENLDYAGNVDDPDVSKRDTIGTSYEYSDEIGIVFGRYYTWNEATGGVSATGLGGGPQGVCPKGWTVPTIEDWTDLAVNVSGDKDLGFFDQWEGLGSKLSAEIKLNDEKLWPYSPNNNHSNDFGWNAIPAGSSKDAHKFFDMFSQYGMWWSSSVDAEDNQNAYYRYIYYNTSTFPPHKSTKDGYGYSVRCVRLAQ